MIDAAPSESAVAEQQPTRRVRYPVPVVVVRGASKGGIVLSDGKAYVFVPDAAQSGSLGRVVGAVALTDGGPVGAVVTSQLAIASVEIPASGMASRDGGQPGADHESSQDQIAADARAEFKRSAATARRVRIEAARELRRRSMGLAGH
jgi:hypothetical protein